MRSRLVNLTSPLSADDDDDDDARFAGLVLLLLLATATSCGDPAGHGNDQIDAPTHGKKS